MKIHLAGNNPYPGIILIRLYESWIGERLGKFGGGYLTTCISEYLNRIPLKEINKDAMRIFLAGGISGNLREFWQKVMKVYCASPNSRKEVIEAMNSFLAGDKDKIMRESIYGADFFVGDGDSTLSGINVLESYYYLRKNEDSCLSSGISGHSCSIAGLIRSWPVPTRAAVIGMPMYRSMPTSSTAST